MIKVMLIAGARPNFMKIAPIARIFDSRGDDIAYKIVHTGQHYDQNMSDIFFEELGIRTPDYHLGAGGGTHSQQTAKIMVEFESICETDRPDLVLTDYGYPFISLAILILFSHKASKPQSCIKSNETNKGGDKMTTQPDIEELTKNIINLPKKERLEIARFILFLNYRSIERAKAVEDGTAKGIEFSKAMKSIEGRFI